MQFWPISISFILAPKAEPFYICTIKFRTNQLRQFYILYLSSRTISRFTLELFRWISSFFFKTFLHPSLPPSASLDLLLSSVLLLIRFLICHTKHHNTATFLPTDLTILLNSPFPVLSVLSILCLVPFSVSFLHDLNVSQFHLFYFLKLFLRFSFC